MITKYRVDLETKEGWIEDDELFDSMTEANLYGFRNMGNYTFLNFKVVAVSAKK